jgi:hypothetical protein
MTGGGLELHRSVGGARRGTLIAAAAGILWPILSAVRLPLMDEVARPIWTSGPSKIVAFYEASAFDTRFMVGVVLVVVGYVLLLAFMAYVASVLADAGGGTWVGGLIVGLTVLTVVLTLGYVGTYATAMFWASHGGLSDDGYLVLHGVSFASYWLALPVGAASGTVLGLAIVFTGRFPVWLGVAILVIAAAQLVAMFGSPNVWNVTSGLPYLTTLALAVIVLRQHDRYAELVSHGVGRP